MAEGHYKSPGKFNAYRIPTKVTADQYEREIIRLHEELNNLGKKFTASETQTERVSKQSTRDIINTIIQGGGGGGSSSFSSSPSSLRIENVLGTTVIDPIARLLIDEDDGYILSSLGASIGRLDFDWTGNPWFRCGRDSVTSSGTTISYSKRLSSPSVIALTCTNAGGDEVGVSFSSVSVTGFIATPLEDATLTWLALPSWWPRSGMALIQPAGTQIVLDIPFPDPNYGIRVMSCISLTSGDTIGVSFPFDGITETDFVAVPLETSLLLYEAYAFQ